MKPRLIRSVVLAFLAIAVQQPASAGEARDTYFRCLATQTATLDDGGSAAEVIARAVVSACLEEGRAMYLSSRDGARILASYDQETLRDKLARFAARVVERYRSSKK